MLSPKPTDHVLSGDDEETKPSEVKEAALPVPPPSVAPPLQTESAPANAAAPVQATEVSTKAHDPRLPPPTQSFEAQAPPPSHAYQQPQETAQMPPMPPMPQAPEPQQPSYNTKEDGYVLLVVDNVVDWSHIYSKYLSFYPTEVDRQNAAMPRDLKQLVFSLITYRTTEHCCWSSSRRSSLSLGRLGQVLAEECSIYLFPHHSESLNAALPHIW